ncbi:YegP family protein [Pseudonocardia zijingensis]
MKGTTMAGKFEVYKDRAGKYRFRLKASNGQVVATGEAYETKSSALKGCESVQKAADGAQIVETDS